MGSQSALSHLAARLDLPRSDSPGGGMGSDFATGYSLGLIGGVRSWVSFLPYFFSLSVLNPNLGKIWTIREVQAY